MSHLGQVEESGRTLPDDGERLGAAVEPAVHPAQDAVDAVEPPQAAPPEEPVDETPAPDIASLAAAVDRLTAETQRHHVRAEQRERVVDRLHEEVQVLRRGERRGLLRPLLTEVSRLRADLLRQSESLPADYDADRARLLLLSFADSVEILLADNGVVAYRPEPGDPFEAQTHRPVGRVPADAPEQVGLVAAVRREGYQDVEAGLPLSPAEVTVFVAGPAATPAPAGAPAAPAADVHDDVSPPAPEES